MLSYLQSMQGEGRLETAEAGFRRIQTQAPTQIYAWLGIAYCASLRGAIDEAGSAVETAVSLLSSDPELVIACSKALTHLGQPEAARALLLRHNTSAVVLVALGEFEESRGRLETAVDLYEASQELDGTTDQPLRKLIQLRRRMGYMAEALATVDRLEARLPRHRAAAWLYRGQIYSAAAHPAKAIEAFQQALDIEPSFDSARHDLARELRQLRRFDAAEAMLSAQRPGYWTHLARSELALHRRDLTLARQHAEAAQALEPRRVDGWARLMRIEIDQGHYAAAHAAIDRMAGCGPEHRIATLRHRLEVLRAEGDEARALEILREAAERQPVDLGIRLELARQHRRLGNRLAAWEALRSVLQRDPDHIGALSDIGDQARQQQDLATALACFRRIAALEPAHLGHQLRLADLLDDLGEGAQAATIRQEAELRFGYSAEFRRYQIRRLREVGALPAALAAARDAFARFPEQMGCWLDLFDLSFKQTTLAECIALIEQAPPHNRSDDISLLQARARLAARMNDKPQAVRHLEAALALQPAHRGALGQLFDLYLRIGDFSSAQETQARQAALDAPARRMRGDSTNASQSHNGQIVNDARLDPDAMEDLRQTSAECHDAAISFLLGLVRKRPHHIPTAITLLSRLEQAGCFREDWPPGNSSSSRPIPRRIIQFWDDPTPPPDLHDLSMSWRKLNPDHEHIVLNEGTAERYLARAFQPQVAAAFRRCRDATTKADLLRLAVLCRDGGIWVDMDDRCLRPLDEVLPPRSEAVFWQESQGTLCNNFIASCPHHPVLRWAFVTAVMAINRGDRDKVWMLTGPGLLTRAFANILAAEGAQWQSWLKTVTVFDEATMWRLMAIHCHASHKRLGKHWSKQSFARGKTMTIGNVLGDCLHTEAACMQDT